MPVRQVSLKQGAFVSGLVSLGGNTNRRKFQSRPGDLSSIFQTETAAATFRQLQAILLRLLIFLRTTMARTTKPADPERQLKIKVKACER